MKKLPDNEIQKITYEIANITTVSAEQRQDILAEFLEINKAKDYLVEGGLDYARTVLSKALGTQRANEILEKITEATQVNRPFAIARKADASQLLNVINSPEFNKDKFDKKKDAQLIEEIQKISDRYY